MYNIKLVKFVSGEEIIGDIKVNVNAGKVSVNNPIRVVIMPPPTPEAKPVIGFSAFMPYSADEDFEFEMKNVLCISSLIPDVAEQWKSIFGKKTSIWLPPSKPDPLAATKAAVAFQVNQDNDKSVN